MQYCSSSAVISGLVGEQSLHVFCKLMKSAISHQHMYLKLCSPKGNYSTIRMHRHFIKLVLSQLCADSLFHEPHHLLPPTGTNQHIPYPS